MRYHFVPSRTSTLHDLSTFLQRGVRMAICQSAVHDLAVARVVHAPSADSVGGRCLRGPRTLSWVQLFRDAQMLTLAAMQIRILHAHCLLHPTHSRPFPAPGSPSTTLRLRQDLQRNLTKPEDLRDHRNKQTNKGLKYRRLNITKGLFGLFASCKRRVLFTEDITVLESIPSQKTSQVLSEFARRIRS